MSKAEEFIKNRTNNQANISIEISNGGKMRSYSQPWLTPDEARKAVEIAREEIYEWLRKNHEEYQYKAPYNYFDIEQCIDNLKQAMKDE